MKKILITIIVCLFQLVSYAESTYYMCCIDGIYYYGYGPEANAVSVVNSTRDGYSGSYSGDVVIPETITYKERTYIVRSIGRNAFANCRNLTSIILPETLVEIETHAFENCSGIKSITIPSSVSKIQKNAFDGCTSLSWLTYNAINVDIDASFDNTIFPCPLQEIVFGDKVETIPRFLVGNFAKITSLTIPESVKQIGDYCFFYCNSLEQLKFNAKSAEFKNPVFSKTLDTVLLGENVQDIPNNFLSSCPNVVKIDLPENLKKIGSNAFYGCKVLSSLYIPGSVESIGKDAFRGCSELTSIVVSKENLFYDSRNDCNAIIETASNKLMWGCRNTILDKSITDVNEFSFWECNGLSNLVIPSNIVSIGGNAFGYCHDLTNVSIPEKVSYIGQGAFIGCNNLKSVHVKWEDPLYVQSATFYDVDYTSCILYVPIGTKSKYMNKSVWKDFLNIEEESTDGIESVIEENKNHKLYYNISGVKSKYPHKGINIINGKKFVQ